MEKWKPGMSFLTSWNTWGNSQSHILKRRSSLSGCQILFPAKCATLHLHPHIRMKTHFWWLALMFSLHWIPILLPKVKLYLLLFVLNLNAYHHFDNHSWGLRKYSCSFLQFLLPIDLVWIGTLRYSPGVMIYRKFIFKKRMPHFLRKSRFFCMLATTYSSSRMD